MDAFDENILGVKGLVEDNTNKVLNNPQEEVGELTDALELKKSDEELLKLSQEWESKHQGYYSKIAPRVERNKKYYRGGESSNLIFEAQETFIPQALAKNPEPVVWSDNTTEGQEASNQIKAMLQYKADTKGLRKKLAISLRHWSVALLGILEHGWSEKEGDFTTTVCNPKDFVYDPDAYIDETGRYIGDFLGKRTKVTAQKLIEKFPKSKLYITLKVDGKLGTKVTYTKWWTDEYCFYTFMDEVLDKHKNQFFNYDIQEKNTEEEQVAYDLEPVTVTPGKNHFAQPIMPYSFLSVFTLQEQPHDITNLIEQSIPNQDRIIQRDVQITRNLRAGNNSIAVSGQSFDKETARQAAQALEDGDPVLVPDGQVERAIKRLPASPLPSGILESQEVDKQTLRNIFGTSGLTPTQPTSQTTARGQILNQDQDSSRIGGGIGESLEQLADNVFNWWLQMMYVFYDEPHYASIVGQGQAITYVQIINSDLNRHFVVSVSPNSMAPKDEISERNQAVELFNAGALDPISLFKKLDFPDPIETAKQVTLYTINPQQYYMDYFGQVPPPPQGQPAGGEIGQEVPTEPTINQPPIQDVLSQVPINK